MVGGWIAGSTTSVNTVASEEVLERKGAAVVALDSQGVRPVAAGDPSQVPVWRRR